MSKQTYKALVAFQGYEPGDVFEADFDPWLAKQFEDNGQIEKAKKQEKEASK